MADEKSKTLSYRRANYLIELDDGNTLEKYLIKAHKKLNTVDLSKIEMMNGLVMECRHFKRKKGVGVFLHLAASTPGEHASIVPIKRGAEQADLSTAPPPKNADYMDGDMMFFVSNNDVVITTNSLHEKKAEFYMAKLFEKAGLDNDSGKFGLTRVADIDKVKLIKAQGVRSITFNSSLYDASVDYLERTTLTEKLSGSIWEDIKALLFTDKSAAALEKAENLTAQLTLKFDNRKAGATISRKALEKVAKSVLTEDEDDDSFEIETLQGEKIGANKIALKKKVNLTSHAKSVWYDEAWDNLEIYFFELKDNGLLEQ